MKLIIKEDKTYVPTRKFLFSLKKLLLLVLFFTMIEFIHSQSCLEFGIAFKTQSQIDSFAINYPDCKNIKGWVYVIEDFSNTITNFNGLANIESIDKFFAISGSHILPDLSGLENLKKVGSLGLIDNKSLRNLKGLENLTEITEGYFRIINNKELINLDELSNLSSMGGEMIITDNSKLKNINGLRKIKSVGGAFNISFNDSLESIEGLGNIISIGKRFYLGYNDKLTSIKALSKVKTIGNSLILTSNRALTSFSGMEGLESIGGDFMIYNNDMITNLDEFNNLKSINGYLKIWGNEELNDINGVKNINYTSINSKDFNIKDIEIFNNTNLSDCNVQTICDVLSLVETTTNIQNNSNGCNTRAEIEYACETNSNEIIYPNYQLIVYPNPAKDLINISIPYEESGKIEIRNSKGILVLKKETNKSTLNINLKLSNFPQGIYYIVFVPNGHDANMYFSSTFYIVK